MYLIILLQTQPSNLLTDSLIIKIIGWALVTLITSCFVLLKYIWNERKEMADADRAVQIEYNKNMTAEIKSLNSYMKNSEIAQAALDSQINTSISKIDTLSKKLDEVSDSHKETLNKIEKAHVRISNHDREIAVIKSHLGKDE